jgi:hypothetical protein
MKKETTLLCHYGQYKYSKTRKSWKKEYRILDYLECMRDWSDPTPWIQYYGDAIRFYVKLLDEEKELQKITEAK